MEVKKNVVLPKKIKQWIKFIRIELLVQEGFTCLFLGETLHPYLERFVSEPLRKPCWGRRLISRWDWDWAIRSKKTVDLHSTSAVGDSLVFLHVFRNLFFRTWRRLAMVKGSFTDYSPIKKIYMARLNLPEGRRPRSSTEWLRCKQ